MSFFCAYGDGYRLIQSSIAVPAASVVRITTSALPMCRRQMNDDQHISSWYQTQKNSHSYKVYKISTSAYPKRQTLVLIVLHTEHFCRILQRRNKNCPTSKYLSGWKRFCLPFIQLWFGSHSCVKPVPCSLQLVLLVLCDLPITKNVGMSKTKYNSETTITQAKCTKKRDEICILCQERQTDYTPQKNQGQKYAKFDTLDWKK